MHEDVPAAHLAQEDAPGCVVEEADVVQWRKAVSPEHDAQDEMLDAGETAVPQSNKQSERQSGRQAEYQSGELSRV